MEFTWSSLVWLSVLLLAALVLQVRKSRNTKCKPPGPPRWPVFGNTFDLGTIPHQTMYRLCPKYGPVLWLELGSINTMVIQSAKAAAELFKNHDLNFCDRKSPVVLTDIKYNEGSLAFGHYSASWRKLRRLCMTELLVNKRISPIRRKCIDNMIKWIEEDTEAAHARGELGEVDVPHVLFVMSFNTIGNLMFSRDLLDSQSAEGYEFSDAMNKIMEWTGKPNVGDFFPLLKWLDLQGLQRNMVRDMGRAMNIVSGFVKERFQEKQFGQEKMKDFLDALLEYEGYGKGGTDKLDRNMIIIIVEMFFAGSETTSSSIEWAMAELLRNPELMGKVKEELTRVVGPKSKVEESDIDELPYLQAVMKETLRLHPPIPLLLPRNTIQDTNFLGYLIPKGTQVFVNAWAIGRDPESWADPLSFKPERFLGSNIEYKGQNFELIPFGSGRRICVGMSMSHRTLHLGLASLIHSFDWELASTVTPETIDMNERLGVTLRKLVHLKAIPKKRIT